VKSRSLILPTVGAIAVVAVALFFFHAQQSPTEPSATPGAAAAPSAPPGIVAPKEEIAAPLPPQETSVAPITHEGLERLMIEAEKAIPSRAELRKLTSEEVHETPATIRAAGFSLGRVAEAVSREPSLAADAFPFYEKCARNVDYPSSVRALCYSDYERIGNGLDLPVNPDVVPASVRELADKVKGL
jgi:hypothetical protein